MHDHRRVGWVLGVLALLVGLPLTACGQAPSTAQPLKGPIIVGSKLDTEGALLSQMMILVLRNNGFEVVDRSQFGATSVVRKAIISSDIDMYPEYTGNGAFFFNEEDSPVWKDAPQGYARVKELDKAKNNIIWLTPAPADNTWAIAVPKSLAASKNLKTLDDFAAYVKSGGYVKLIGSEEFVTSPAALPAFQKAYGFTLGQDQLVTVSSGETAQTEKAAAEGTGGVNAAMAYGTDGGLQAFGLVVLADTKKVQPVYAPTPIIRGAVNDKYPEIGTLLKPVFEKLDLTILQTLNAQIDIQGQKPVDVAAAYLTQNSFLKQAVAAGQGSCCDWPNGTP